MSISMNGLIDAVCVGGPYDGWVDSVNSNTIVFPVPMARYIRTQQVRDDGRWVYEYDETYPATP